MRFTLFDLFALGMAAAIILAGIAAGLPQAVAFVLSAVISPVLYVGGLFAVDKIKARHPVAA